MALIAASPLPAAVSNPHWVATWASAQQEPEERNALASGTLKNATLRQLVRVTQGGSRIRVRISNAFGRAPLRIGGVSVALSADAASPAIKPGSVRAVAFGGSRSFTIPAGAEFISDPIQLPVPDLATLAISTHFLDHPDSQTGHPGSRATSYIVSGNQLAAPGFENPAKVDHWYNLSEVDIPAPDASSAIAVLGDSITDGFGVQPNTNARWTDRLAQRLLSSGSRLTVINLGLGGNRLLNDGLGPNATARFERDVIARSGIAYLVLLEGVNDLGTLTREKPASPAEHAALVAGLLDSFKQITAKARERGIKVIGATIMPYGRSSYYHPDEANEADRQAVNAWLRRPGNVDAVIDFDAIMRDPTAPRNLRADLDSGDGLHPSLPGYRAMADAVPLSVFSTKHPFKKH